MLTHSIPPQDTAELRVSILQIPVVWEDKTANLAQVEKALSTLPPTDVLILPEMFTTAFSMNAPALAEATEGPTFQQICQWAQQYQVAITGSFIAQKEGHYYNHGFFVEPNGTSYSYDKKHLFIAGEEKVFTPGKEPLIVHYKGWNLFLAICYDLRFPVWLRNTSLQYDALIVMAEWPVNRQDSFESLLLARSIENQAYVCACNRIGDDAHFLHYIGGSQIIDYKGKILARCQDDKEEIITATLSKVALKKMREKMPFWKQADPFSLI